MLCFPLKSQEGHIIINLSYASVNSRSYQKKNTYSAGIVCFVLIIKLHLCIVKSYLIRSLRGHNILNFVHRHQTHLYLGNALIKVTSTSQFIDVLWIKNHYTWCKSTFYFNVTWLNSIIYKTWDQLRQSRHKWFLFNLI